MNEETRQWGVVFEGRDLGWIAYDTRDEAQAEALHVEDRYAPARLAYRELGPVQIVIDADSADCRRGMHDYCNSGDQPCACECHSKPDEKRDLKASKS